MARYRVRDERLLRKAPRNPEGGWLPPKTKELHKFIIEFRDEAIRRFGVDEDGDACVLVAVCDNSRQESTGMNYECIPREIEENPYHPYAKRNWNKSVQDPTTKKWSTPKHTPEQEEARNKAILENKAWRRRMIMLNFAIAKEEMEQMLRMDEYEIQKQIEAPQNARAARIKTLEALEEKWSGDVFTYYEGRGYVVDRDARTMYYPRDKGTPQVYKIGEKPADYPRDKGTPQVYKIGEKPADYDERMKELKKLRKFKLPKAKTF